MTRVLSVRDEDRSAAGPFRIEFVNSGLQSLRIFIDFSLHLVHQVTVYIIPAGGFLWQLEPVPLRDVAFDELDP